MEFVESFRMDTILSWWHISMGCFRIFYGEAMSSSVRGSIGICPRTYILLPFYRPVGEIFRNGLKYHCSADDTHVCMTIRSWDNWENYCIRLESCLQDIGNWMSSSLLKLNQEKTELFSHQNSKIPLSYSLKSRATSSIVLLLFVILEWSLKSKFATVTKSCNYYISNVGRIRRFTSTYACQTRVNYMVTARLWYGRSLLFRINKDFMSQ